MNKAQTDRPRSNQAGPSHGSVDEVPLPADLDIFGDKEPFQERFVFPIEAAPLVEEPAGAEEVDNPATDRSGTPADLNQRSTSEDPVAPARGPTTRLHIEKSEEATQREQLQAFRSAARRLQSFVVVIQWAFVVTTLVALAELGIATPLRRTTAGDLTAGFWIWLSFPTAFFAGLLGSFLAQSGRVFAEGTAGRRVARWFYPVYALRDCATVGFVFAGAYGALVWYLHTQHPSQIPISPLSFAVAGAPGLPPDPAWIQQATVTSWLIWRGLPALVVGSLTLASVCALRIVDRDALIGVRVSLPTLLCYGAVIAAGVFCFPQTFLVRWAMDHPGRIWVIGPCVIAGLFLVLLALGGLAASNLAHRYRMDRGIALPATIAVVGPTMVGKTVFITRAYSLLKNDLVGMFRVTPVDERSSDFDALGRIIHEERRFPPGGTQKATDIPFVLREGADEVLQFSWLDMPGDAFTNPLEWTGEVEAFQAQLTRADAIAMFVDAQQLVQGRGSPEVFQQRVYLDQIDAMFSVLARQENARTSIPLAIIVAQSGRYSPQQQALFPGMVKAIQQYYEGAARKVGRRLPPVRIFLSTAVMANPPNSDRIPSKPEPIQSFQCREPLLWLAAEVLRSNLSALETARGFFGGARLLNYIRAIEYHLG